MATQLLAIDSITGAVIGAPSAATIRAANTWGAEGAITPTTVNGLTFFLSGEAFSITGGLGSVSVDVDGVAIATSSGDGYISTLSGGYIDTSDGGVIDTSNGGGGISTLGTGIVQMGVLATRTTLTGSATAARAIAMPDASGTILLSNGSGASLTALNASALTSGTITPSRLGSGNALEVLRRNAGNTALEFAPSAGGGTVTSVGIATADGISASSPITTAGELTITLGDIIPTTVNSIAFTYIGSGSFTIASTLGGGTASSITVSSSVAAVISAPFGDAAFMAASTFATAAQGSLADSSLQPADNLSALTSPVTAVQNLAGGTAPIADATYTVGLGLLTNGTITTKNGIITSIVEAS